MNAAKIAIFASGSGTNAQNIVLYMRKKTNSFSIIPTIILSNRPDAYVLERAGRLNVKSHTFTAKELRDEDIVDNILTNSNIEFIVLAGFLLKLPDRFIQRYRGRIINIHPSLLPKFGGKGMYGDAVHKAVIESGEKESGITIHLVDEIYDNGEHIFQARCNISEGETPDTLANKIHELEKEHFPRVICEYIKNYPTTVTE
ncbi:MAG: phosphoribosylglycinamide formyltransferase [Bacteroidales bacterium]